MIADARVAERYARSFFLLSEKRGIAESFQKELEDLLSSLQTHPELSRLLTATTIAQSEKEELIEHLLKDRCSELLIHCLKLLVRKGRFVILNRILEKFHDLYNETHRIAEIRAVSRYGLPKSLEERLKRALEQRTGKKVLLSTEVDPSILGGLMVYTKNQVIDGSLRTRLRELKQLLLP